MKSLSWDPMTMAQQTLQRMGKTAAATHHRAEAERLRGKSGSCHDAAGGHTNSSAKFDEMAAAHDAAATILETAG